MNAERRLCDLQKIMIDWHDKPKPALITIERRMVELLRRIDDELAKSPLKP
jgi:hypothetical protein